MENATPDWWRNGPQRKVCSNISIERRLYKRIVEDISSERVLCSDIASLLADDKWPAHTWPYKWLQTACHPGRLDRDLAAVIKVYSAQVNKILHPCAWDLNGYGVLQNSSLPMRASMRKTIPHYPRSIVEGQISRMQTPGMLDLRAMWRVNQ